MASASSDLLEGNWSQEKLTSEVLSSRDTCISWCQRVGLLPSKRNCPKNGKHEMIMTKSSRKYSNAKTCTGKRWRCHKHSVTRTIAKNTWFEFHNIEMEDVLRLTYYFARGFKYQDAHKEIKRPDRSDISQETIADMYFYCREICMLTLDRMIISDGLIGGRGKVVEIDEMKFPRRQYKSGRVVEARWILGAIDAETKELRLEVRPDDKRDSGTLVSVIKKHIAPGTLIYSESPRAYDYLNDEDLQHLSVDHSIDFLKTEPGADVQPIESEPQWRSLRFALHRRGVQISDINYHLCEYLWRKEGNKNGLDLFAEMIRSIRTVCPGIGD